MVQREGGAYALAKDADVRFGRSRYVALYNSSDEEREFTVRADALDLGGTIDAFDLVEMADVGCFEDCVSVMLAPHAAKFYRFDAERRLQRRVYEAETAFLADYQELHDATKAGTAFPEQHAGASGGVVVRFLGGRASNDLVWPEVNSLESGDYVLAIDYVSPEDRAFVLSVDGAIPTRVEAPATGGKVSRVEVPCRLEAGMHAVRLSNPDAWMPDVDRMIVTARSTEEAATEKEGAR